MTRDDYVVAHVREALAGDPRVGVLDVRVSVVASQLVLTGPVASQERRAAIIEVATEVADLPVVDELTVLTAECPSTSEDLPA